MTELFADRRSWSRVALIALMSAWLAGCADVRGYLGMSGSWLPSMGPSATKVRDAGSGSKPEIPVIAVTDAVARQQAALQEHKSFSQVFADHLGAPYYAIGPGDILTVSIWEAPPAVLFSTFDVATASTNAGETALPEQMVAADGTISVPFAGAVRAAGYSPQQVGEAIRQRLVGKANNPQVVVRVIRNVTANVTVVGDVKDSITMPLTAKGERLLDALAQAGGTREPIDKMVLQLSRGGTTAAMPLDSIIRDPKQNIALSPSDVVTALFQTNSFIALGAAGANQEVPFEAQGIRLSQALGRIHGLQPALADARGVFLFRWEDPAVAGEAAKTAPRTPDGKVAVIYWIDLAQPATFLAAQNFPVGDKDVIYVSTAPAAELQTFLSMVTSSLSTAATVKFLGQ